MGWEQEWGEAELCPGLQREGSSTRGWGDRSALLNLEGGNEKGIIIIIILLVSFKCRGCLKDKIPRRARSERSLGLNLGGFKWQMEWGEYWGMPVSRSLLARKLMGCTQFGTI